MSDWYYYQFMDDEEILGTVIVPEDISEERIKDLYRQWINLTMTGIVKSESIDLFVEWLIEVQDIDADRLFVIPIKFKR